MVSLFCQNPSRYLEYLLHGAFRVIQNRRVSDKDLMVVLSKQYYHECPGGLMFTSICFLVHRVGVIISIDGVFAVILSQWDINL